MRAKGVVIEGLDELRETLERVAPRQAQNILRSAIHATAGKVRNSMRRRAPSDRPVLKKSIKSVRRRVRAGALISDVVITKGRGERYDGFHWHFIEFGTRHHRAQPFIRPTVREVQPQVPMIMREEFGKKFERAMARAKK